MNLKDITVGIKTFLRPEFLNPTMYNITKMLPECQMIVADDSDEVSQELNDTYGRLTATGQHQIIRLDFDSGFGRKSNEIVKALRTPYLLIGSDDFDFSNILVRYGIIRMAYVLENRSDLSIVSGRVNNNPYEFNLVDNGDTITEVFTPNMFNEAIVPCDLTVNYSLIRREVFDKVSWDDDVKIGGGEHGAFFLDCKRAGFKTAYAPGVNIPEQRRRSSLRYQEFRNRAYTSARPCFDKRGIKKYILGDGTVDYVASSS